MDREGSLGATFADPSSHAPFGALGNGLGAVERHIIFLVIWSEVPEQDGITLLGFNLNVDAWEESFASHFDVGQIGEYGVRSWQN